MAMRTKEPRSPRVNHGGAVAFKARNQHNDRGLVKNVSESGALLISQSKYLEGTDLVVYLPLNLGSRKTLCMASGKIVRIQGDLRSARALAYGVKFDEDLSNSSRQLLKDYVAFKKDGKIAEKAEKKSPRRLSPFRD